MGGSRLTWRKETLNLEVGDFIIWQDEAIEVEGQPAVVTPGMNSEKRSELPGKRGLRGRKHPPTACLWDPIWTLFRKMASGLKDLSVNY